MPPQASVTEPSAAAAALEDARRRTLRLVEGITDEDLERVHSPLMSPLAWDLGHIAAFEDLWLVHRLGGEPMLREDLGHVYDAFETPRSDRGDLPFLRAPEARAYLEEVREHALAALRSADADADGSTIPELVIRHEHQHQETMLQSLQLARLEGYEGPGREEPPWSPSERHTGLETVAVPAGAFPLGAGADGFAYDNELPRHTVELAAFRIGAAPITNGTWMRFADGGGYERREWWSDEAWRWKEEYDITLPGGWTDDGREWRMGRLEPLHPSRPVVHVSWFEADAFARAHGVRLPTEAEWEKAATWDQRTESKRTWPWGKEPPGAAQAAVRHLTLGGGRGLPGSEGSGARPAQRQHANLDARVYGTAPVGSYPAGASPCGALAMVGDVWEWTAGELRGYPGFVAHPYPEYSEVFFGTEHKVLRGGSWASAGRVALPTFRNWDLPARRQIFAGVRIAQDGA
ncbi:ergothioneine biosynthesis protein EgtB [soil metagenome]